jgi:hypothetical protein
LQANRRPERDPSRHPDCGSLANHSRPAGEAVGHRLDALAIAIGEQAVEVDATPTHLPRAVEVGTEVFRVAVEPVENVRRQFRGVGSVYTCCAT